MAYLDLAGLTYFLSKLKNNFVDIGNSQTITGSKKFSSNIDGAAKSLYSTSLGSDYEMNYQDFANNAAVSVYSVTSFKANTSSAPSGNVGDYTLIRIYQGLARYACFLCRSPRDKKLFMGNFWQDTWSGWSEVFCSSSNGFFEAGANTLGKTTDNECLYLVGASSISKGAYMVLNGESLTDYEGHFAIHAQASPLDKTFTGRPDGTLLWNGQAIQTSSDERMKTSLDIVPDDVLDAWGDVQWGQFQFLEAVQEKGDKARLHVGVIAQRVKAAFEARGLDACAYGVLCHEERPAVDREQTVVDCEAYADEKGDEHPAVTHVETVHEDAVDLWMVRYTEALALETACQRRRADRLEARIAALEAKLA